MGILKINRFSSKGGFQLTKNQENYLASGIRFLFPSIKIDEIVNALILEYFSLGAEILLRRVA